MQSDALGIVKHNFRHRKAMFYDPKRAHFLQALYLIVSQCVTNGANKHRNHT